MLSLENAASGTNLTEATHVILMDPVAGTSEEARAIEDQAIGRAHRLGQDRQITVVRMIMRETIEEELYLVGLEHGNLFETRTFSLTMLNGREIRLIRCMHPMRTPTEIWV